MRILVVLVWLGVLSGPLGAMGGAEYVETPLGSPVDENTPRQRIYQTPAGETLSLEVVGPVDLRFKNGKDQLVLTGVLGLLDQTQVTLTSQGWAVRLESGLNRPSEGGRLTLEVSLPMLEKLILRSQASGDVEIDQKTFLTVEVRDESRLTGVIRIPEIQGLFTWKSRGELKGEVGKETWTLRGESRLRVVDLQGQDAAVVLWEGSRLLMSRRTALSGELRRKSLVMYAPGQDVTGLELKEESVLELLP